MIVSSIMLPRRYRNTLLKLVVVIPLLWLVVTLFLHSSSDSKSDSSQQKSHKHRDKHKQGGPRAEARVDLLHNSNRLGEKTFFELLTFRE